MVDQSYTNPADALTSHLFESLKRHPKRIVFTEGEDIRVLKAAEYLVSNELIAPILLGNRDKIIALADEHGINRKFINILNPAEASDLELFCDRLENIERYRGREIANPKEMITRPHNFAAMMLQYRQADGMVSGNAAQPATIFRALANFVKPLKEVSKLYGTVALTAPHLQHVGKDGMLFLADCGVNPDPSVQELAEMAVETGKLAGHLLGHTPRVAMLSHSSHGSMPTASAKKMGAAAIQARELAKRQLVDVQIDGEIQADVALDMAAAELKFKDDRGLEPADVLIFPNLDSSHIAYKLLQHVGGAQTYGQLIMGLTRHAAQIPKTASVQTIIGTAALVGCESIKFRQLYPDGYNA